MDNNHKTEKGLLNHIRENWMIVVAIFGLVITWTTLNTRLSTAETKLIEQQTVINQIQEIQISIAVIQEKITSIEKILNK